MTPREARAKVDVDVAAFRQRVDTIRAQRAAVEPDRSPRVTTSVRSFLTSQSSTTPQQPDPAA